MRINTFGPASLRAGDIGETRTPESTIADLRFDIERLLMITEALWSILKEKHGHTDEDLAREITRLDLEDGNLDGRVSRRDAPLPCPKCQRPLHRHRPRCLYCGEPVGVDPFAR